LPGFDVQVTRDVRIRVRDGRRLAADIFLPVTSERVPALLEAYPYRKTDNLILFLQQQAYFAQRGFAAVRLDLRGTGNSEGVLLDEYTRQEQDDLCDVIEWLASQQWCNGNVGMFGWSWGGFSAIQVAMRNPPALKAIVPLFATDDRYTDDVHSAGGTLRAASQIGYPLRMIALNALPPTPEIDGWAEAWSERLEYGRPWPLRWIDEQVDGPFWRHGSLSSDYHAVKVPIFSIGGWRDVYRNQPLRTYVRCPVPQKVLIGPWTHMLPHQALPGPRIDHLHEMARFFGHWLRGETTGTMDEPPIALFVQERPDFTGDMTNVPGHWRYESGWPPDGVSDQTFYLTSRFSLSPIPEPHESLIRYDYVPSAGVAMQSIGANLDYGDQRVDDAFSLCFDSAPLDAPTEILGLGRARLAVSSTAEVMTFVVRVCDVSPNGSSYLVTRGLLNGTHRNSHRQPEAMTPGQTYHLEIPLDCISHVFATGHRVRVSINSSAWPMVWPAPTLGQQLVTAGGSNASHVVLPVVASQDRGTQRPDFRPAPELEPTAVDTSAPPEYEVTRDPRSMRTKVRSRTNAHYRMDGAGIEFEASQITEAQLADLDPAHATYKGENHFTLRRPEATFESRAQLAMTSSATHFHVWAALHVLTDGRQHFQRSWRKTVRRHLT
jgi:putative CocE/NonD family hydrolase